MPAALLFGQSPTVKASIDSISIMVGSQAKIRLEISKALTNNITIPLLSDSIIQGLEIVDVPKLDTVKFGNNQEQINVNYSVTSFDEGLYYIPPFAVVSQNDTIYSNSLSLKVNTMKVDTVSKAFYDIKPVLSPRFVLADYIYILVIVWVILVILAVLIYFLFFKPKKAKLIFKKKTELPPHVKALRALEEIKQKNLWQQGLNKEYHTQLTDVLRTYLFERFGISAQEMTSDEILSSVQAYHEAESASENLKQVLKLADLAKFAKFTPLPNENDLSYVNSRLFISQTQPEEVPEKNDQKNSQQENNPASGKQPMQ
jgi:hypothetical protein